MFNREFNGEKRVAIEKSNKFQNRKSNKEER